MRDAKEAAASAYKKQEDALKSDMNAVAQLLIEAMDANKVDGMKTVYGSVSKVIKSKYWSSNWEAMKQFAVEHQDLGGMSLFEQRIAQKNMTEFLAKNPSLVPIGLELDRKYDVRVVRATVKPEAHS